jgi:hypothetical protein
MYYAVYSRAYFTWCVFKDNGTPYAELIKSGFVTQEDAKAYIRTLK